MVTGMYGYFMFYSSIFFFGGDVVDTSCNMSQVSPQKAMQIVE